MWYVFGGLSLLLILGMLVALWATHRRRPNDTEDVARQRLRKGQTIMSVLGCANGACGLVVVSINPVAGGAFVWIIAILLLVFLAGTAAHLRSPKR